MTTLEEELAKIDFDPKPEWESKNPADWPARFALLPEDTKFNRYKYERGGYTHSTYIVPRGTKVRIVMSSRFGDLGITTDLAAVNGYGCRVLPEELILLTDAGEVIPPRIVPDNDGVV